jgi:outer membrane protein assembly factor BamD (BamD/ComL family)
MQPTGRMSAARDRFRKLLTKFPDQNGGEEKFSDLKKLYFMRTVNNKAYQSTIYMEKNGLVRLV